MLVNVSHSFMSDSATPWTVGGCSPPLSSAHGIFQEYCNFLLPGIFLILELRSPTSGPLGKPKYVLSLFFNFLVKKCFIEVFIAVVQFTQGECLEIHRLFTALMLADTVTCVWWTRTSLGWRSELTEPWVTPWSCVTEWFIFHPFPFLPQIRMNAWTAQRAHWQPHVRILREATFVSAILGLRLLRGELNLLAPEELV